VNDQVPPEEDPERAEALSEIEPESLPHELPGNSGWKLALRLAFSIGLVALLIWSLPDVSLGEIFPEPTPATFAWIALALVVLMGAFALQALRWFQVSRTLEMEPSFGRLFSHVLAGEFISKALPTSFGGDVVRVIRQGNDADDYADAFASVSLERLSGWIILPVISFVGLALDPALTSLGGPSHLILVVNLLTLAGLTALLWIAGHPRGAGRWLEHSGWRRYIGAIHLGIVEFRKAPVNVWKVLGSGLGFQILQCISVWACARALQIDGVSVVVCLAFFPPAAVLQNFPLSLGGLGVREAVFLFLFGAIGVSNSDAIALGLLVYAIFILASLAGAPSFFSGGFTGKKVAAGAGRPADPGSPGSA
jgi:uncharacterized protein (TIRG00374 family)